MILLPVGNCVDNVAHVVEFFVVAIVVGNGVVVTAAASAVEVAVNVDVA